MDVDQRDPVRILCMKCGTEKLFESYQHASRMSHWGQCRICDSCFRPLLINQFPKGCLLCDGEYSTADNESLRIWRIKTQRAQEAIVVRDERQKISLLTMQKGLELGRKPSEIWCKLCEQKSENFLISTHLEHDCVICDECFLLRVRKALPRLCLACSEPLIAQDLENMNIFLSQRIKEIKSMPLVSCTICKETRTRYEVFTCKRLHHQCFVCDICLDSRTTAKSCPKCCVDYDKTDQVLLEAVFPRKVAERPVSVHEEAKRSEEIRPEISRNRACMKCHVEKSISQFMLYLRNPQNNFLCDDCYYQKPSNPNIQPLNLKKKVEKVVLRTLTLDIYCTICGQEQPVGMFAISADLSHWWKCRECNSCFEKRIRGKIPRECANCQDLYNHYDTTKLMARKRFLEESKQALPLLPAQPRQPDSRNLNPFSNTHCHVCEKEAITCTFHLCVVIGHPCRVCDDCYIIYNLRMPELKSCPSCKQDLEQRVGDEITSMRNERSLKPENQEILRCLQCRKEVKQTQMLMCKKLSHSCHVCDNCLLKPGKRNICMTCLKQYEAKDLAYLSKIHPKPSSSQTQPLPRSEKMCDLCQSPFTEVSFKCQHSCVCSLCVLKHQILSRTICPRCKTQYEGRVPDVFQCAGCCRDLEINGFLDRKVSGVCANNCILCIFCIKFKHGRALCKCCDAEVQTAKLGNIKDFLQNYQLGCYCAESTGQRTQPVCDHEIHEKCLLKLYNCRICDKMIKERPEVKKLTEYLIA